MAICDRANWKVATVTPQVHGGNLPPRTSSEMPRITYLLENNTSTGSFRLTGGALTLQTDSPPYGLCRWHRDLINRLWIGWGNQGAGWGCPVDKYLCLCG